jgi:AcrR family transcriptional regulator
LTVAAKSFGKLSYSGTDIDVMCGDLAVSKGTVYRYFRSKEELFLAAVDREMTLLLQSVIAAAGETEDLLQKVVNGIRAYLSFFDEHPHVVELLIQERALFADRKTPTYFEHRDRTMNRWREFFVRMQDAGLVREIAPDSAIDVVSDLLYGRMFTNHFAGRKRTLDEQVLEILDISFNGVLKHEVSIQTLCENFKGSAPQESDRP